MNIFLRRISCYMLNVVRVKVFIGYSHVKGIQMEVQCKGREFGRASRVGLPNSIEGGYQLVTNRFGFTKVCIFSIQGSLDGHSIPKLGEVMDDSGFTVRWIIFVRKGCNGFVDDGRVENVFKTVKEVRTQVVFWGIS